MNAIGNKALPIHTVLPQLLDTLEKRSSVILQADPGAGKSTVVPLALLEADWLQGKKILLLEPRRIAARSVAEWMAKTLGEKTGETVGYRMRLDQRISAKTRIEVVTEGILTRQIQHDPELADVGCIIFDEFHERSLQADLGLVLARDIQQALRDDLRLLLMSATMDASHLSSLLDDAPVVRSEGRQFPVETHYLPRSDDRPSPARVAHVILEALQKHEGNLLAFLPGTGEIRATEARLREQLDSNDVLITPLHGSLDIRQQRLAIEPPPPGKRKVVLATSIAETSLTIEGIHIVVDAGLERRPEFDPRTGMTGLVTVAASSASADQRRGRAGRLGPGHCYRLWSEAEHKRRPAWSAPEIMLADLAPVVMELARWGVSDPLSLDWPTPPPEKAWRNARNLLVELEIIDQQGRLTHHGKELATLPVHPRLAHMIVTANRLGAGKTACDIAALLQERSPYRGELREPDFAARLSLLAHSVKAKRNVDAALLARAKAQSRELQRLLGNVSDQRTLSAGAISALAYPDRIGQARGGSSLSYRLSGGGSAAFSEPNTISSEPWLVMTELDNRGREARIFSSVATTRGELEQIFHSRIKTVETTLWDEQQQAVVAEQKIMLGELVLEEKAGRPDDAEEIRKVLINAIKKHGISCVSWSKAATGWREQVQFLHGLDLLPLPDLSDQALLENIETWLGSWLDGISSFSDLAKLDLLAILKNQLDWDTQQKIDEFAPTHFTVPSGSRLPLRYQKNSAPVLAVRMQEMYSCQEQPTIANGRVKILLHLLSPAQRPLQITDDIAGFWNGSYQEIRKEMRGRYPKHNWPEDPRQALPHRGVRPPDKH